MIEVKADMEQGLVVVKVVGKLEEGELQDIAGPVVDEIIAEQGQVKGLLLDATGFEGWDGLPSLLSHLKFVKHHQKFIRKVALVGNHTWPRLGVRIGGVWRHGPCQVAAACPWPWLLACCRSTSPCCRCRWVTAGEGSRT